MILLGFAAMVAAVLLASVWGGRPERLGAALTAICWIAYTLAQLRFGQGHGWVLIAPDVAFGLGVLALAWRYGRTWTFLSLASQSVVLLLHAVLFVSPDRPPMPFIAAFNALSVLGLLFLALGAVGPHLRRALGFAPARDDDLGSGRLERARRFERPTLTLAR